MIGWQDYLVHGKQFKPGKRFLKTSWIIFWIVNILLLFPVTTMYSKKARVEAMIYLSQYNDIGKIMIENTVSNKIPQSPIFYAQQRIKDYGVTTDNPLSNFAENVRSEKEHQPRFILFLEPEKLDERVSKIKEVYPNIIYETTINPGWLDKILYWLNPLNANQTIVIYRNRDFYP
jgi:hypothetical protein